MENNNDQDYQKVLDPLPESVWNDPDYQKNLEHRAEVDEVINRYEKGLG